MTNRNVETNEEKANIMDTPVVDITLAVKIVVDNFAEAIDNAYREATSSGKTQYVILCISPEEG